MKMIISMRCMMSYRYCVIYSLYSTVRWSLPSAAMYTKDFCKNEKQGPTPRFLSHTYTRIYSINAREFVGANLCHLWFFPKYYASISHSHLILVLVWSGYPASTRQSRQGAVAICPLIYLAWASGNVVGCSAWRLMVSKMVKILPLQRE